MRRHVLQLAHQGVDHAVFALDVAVNNPSLGVLAIFQYLSHVATRTTGLAVPVSSSIVTNVISFAVLGR